MGVKLRVVGLYYNNELDYAGLKKSPISGGCDSVTVEGLLNGAENANSDKNVKSFSYRRDRHGIRWFSARGAQA